MIQIKFQSPIKIVKQGYDPDVTTLNEGELAYGIVADVARLYGNTGTSVEQVAVEEAPNDGKAYVRKNKGWVVESTPPKAAITLTGTPGVTVTGNGTYLVNTQVTVTAVVSAGYNWWGWYQDQVRVSRSKTYTFIASGNVTLEAFASMTTEEPPEILDDPTEEPTTPSPEDEEEPTTGPDIYPEQPTEESRGIGRGTIESL
jgi:hypothetical protein